MKALARTLLIALSGAWALAATLPAHADHGRGWEYRDHDRGQDWRDNRQHWRDNRPHRPVYGPPTVIHRTPVVVYRPAVVVYESPVVYERRVYHGPTSHLYYGEPYVSFTLPLR